MKSILQTLPANLLGRDFVCGDIHGSYSCVERFLREINFDKAKDRLICVGDLIDRGPENEKCLDLLNEPWFFSVAGNHEDLMIKYLENHPDGIMYWPKNGGHWVHKYEYDRDVGALVEKYLDKLKSLPLFITVEQKDGRKFHVMHAELAADEPITDEDVCDEYTLAQLCFRHTSLGNPEPTVLWGRYRFMNFFKRAVTEYDISKARRGSLISGLSAMYSPNLSQIYSGHTLVVKPLQYYGQTDLDTMAFASYEKDAPEWAGLTVTEPATGKFWLANDRVFTESTPVIID